MNQTQREEMVKIPTDFEDNYIEYTDQGVYVSYEGKNGVDIDDYVKQVYTAGVEAGKKEGVNKLKKLLDDHCCRVYAGDHNGTPSKECKKEHLYCGYELDHGIRLERVIALLSNNPQDEKD